MVMKEVFIINNNTTIINNMLHRNVKSIAAIWEANRM